METVIELLKAINPFYFLLLLPLVYLIFKSPRNLPPGPFPWPIIGNILSLGKKPHVSLTQLATSFGPLMSLRLGTQLVVVASSPDAAAEILKTNDRILSARAAPHAVPVYPDRMHLSMVWSDCTDQWKFLRSLVKTDLFSNKMIEDQAKIRELKVLEMVEFLHTKEGEAVTIAELTFNVVFNMLSTIFVSSDFINLYGESKPGAKVNFRKFLESLSAPNLEDYYTIFRGLDLQGLNKKTNEIMGKITALWEVPLKERKENSGKDASRPRDLLDSLLQRGITKEQIDYLFLELFIAGTDTTTSTVEWALSELLKKPEAMEKVLDELKREIKGTVVKDHDLTSLRYLHCVVKEVLRLHPAAPLLVPHRAFETCKVMNYTIPKDAQIFINVWAIGRDSKIWGDPLFFKPERFLETGLELYPTDFKFLPFGCGRRICPGLPMASKQVTLILASLLNCFEWSLPPGMHPSELDMVENFSISLQKQKPLVLIPKIKNHRP